MYPSTTVPITGSSGRTASFSPSVYAVWRSYAGGMAGGAGCNEASTNAQYHVLGMLLLAELGESNSWSATSTEVTMFSRTPVAAWITPSVEVWSPGPNT